MISRKLFLLVTAFLGFFGKAFWLPYMFFLGESALPLVVLCVDILLYNRWCA